MEGKLVEGLRPNDSHVYNMHEIKNGIRRKNTTTCKSPSASVWKLDSTQAFPWIEVVGESRAGKGEEMHSPSQTSNKSHDKTFPLLTDWFWGVIFKVVICAPIASHLKKKSCQWRPSPSHRIRLPRVRLSVSCLTNGIHLSGFRFCGGAMEASTFYKLHEFLFTLLPPTWTWKLVRECMTLIQIDLKLLLFYSTNLLTKLTLSHVPRPVAIAYLSRS